MCVVHRKSRIKEGTWPYGLTDFGSNKTLPNTSSINLRQFICAEFPSHDHCFAHGSAQYMEAA